MRPDDFLSIAQELINVQTEFQEALCRTVIGRTYYSSFLLSKAFCINQGQIQLLEYDREGHPTPGKIHSAVRDALKEIKFFGLSDQLFSLSEDRVIADYNLNETISISSAEDAIDLASEINEFILLYF